jgi:hypothetical protein
MTIIVKGNRHAAARAAADRGIPFAFLREVDGWTVGDAGDAHLDAVAAWLAEPGETAPGIGYRDGTCLHYVVREEVRDA